MPLDSPLGVSSGETCGGEGDGKRGCGSEGFFGLDDGLAGVVGGRQFEDGQFSRGGVEEPVGRDLVLLVERAFEDYVGGSGGGGEDLDRE